MKTVAVALATAGLATLLSFGAANAQTAGATGTGTAAQQDRPSTAGVGNPGGSTRMMRMTKSRGMKMRVRSRRHR